MKRMILIAALAATVGAAYAHQEPTAPAPTAPAPTAPAKKAPAKKAPAKPATTFCAVDTDHKVVIAEADKDITRHADYKGKRYYFCCPGCKPQFEKNPAKFAKAAKGFPIPKTAPKPEPKKPA